MDVSKFRAAWRPRKRDDIADGGHSGEEWDGAFQAEAEAGVGDGAEAAEIQIPPIVGGIEVLLGHALLEDVEAFFALAAADDLADLGDEDVHGADRFAVIIDAHVERLE